MQNGKLKFLEDNIGVNPGNLENDEVFLDKTPKAQSV